MSAPQPGDVELLHRENNINRLWLEDVLDPSHLPKYEEAENLKFLLMRENTHAERQSLNSISDVSTKLGVFITGRTLITIHRLESKSVAKVKEFAERAAHPHLLTPEQLALQLALNVLKTFDDESQLLSDELDKEETAVFMGSNKGEDMIRRLYRIKRKAGLNTRIVNLSAEWIHSFDKMDLDAVAVRDLYDKQRDVISDFDHLTAQVTNLINMFLALSDQKNNQAMKVLSVYSVYFLPITFIAGVYGMNFDNMPELHNKYAYFITMGIMAVIVVITYFYLRKKNF